jgi:hypothetical protein
VTEAQLFGNALLRIDIPGDGGTMTTQYYGNAAIFSLTPTTEALARAVAKHNQPQPAYRWELPQGTPTTAGMWEQCSLRNSCDRGIRCIDCDVYSRAMTREYEGSGAGEEDP